MRSSMPAGFDAWLTTDPNIVDLAENWEMLRRCSCGCFLRMEPDRHERIENIVTEECIDGSREAHDWSFTRLFFTCRRCKKENVFEEM